MSSLDDIPNNNTGMARVPCVSSQPSTYTSPYITGIGISGINSLTSNTVSAISGLQGAMDIYSNSIVLSKEGTLDIRGDVSITGKLKVDGVDFGESLKRIEERLNILRPNVDIEERWEELRALGDQYRELEAEILGREELIKILIK